MERRVSQPGLDVSAEIKRMLGIGQGTLADKERDYQSRHTVKAPEPRKAEMRMFGGVWHIADGAEWREATVDEIMRHVACVTILDNGDD
jgi:hypothetical protein